jgi:drug/metabolite transporter (DMT)-like permease
VLLALSSQVLGWLLISISLPRLPAALTSMILTIQPVGSVVLGIVLLGESPTALQLCGAACILAGLVSVAARRRIQGPAS